MANSDYDREREINEIGRDKVAANNKKHAMNVKKRKEELAKKVDGGKKIDIKDYKRMGMGDYVRLDSKKKGLG